MIAKRNPRDLLRAATPTMIMSVLDRYSVEDAPGLHGYGITQEIQSLSGKKFTLGQASLYPVLHSLLDQGFVEFTLDTPEKGPSRKLYRLTESGRAEFEAQRASLEADLDSLHTVIYGGKPSVSTIG